MRTRDTPTISTSDMDTIATAFPALQHLAISNMLMGRRHQLQLQPLSRLTGLRALSLASDALMPESILASLTCLKGLPRLELTLRWDPYWNACEAILPHLQHVSSLVSLSFGMDVYLTSETNQANCNFSCLWGLQQLTHLAFPGMTHYSGQNLGISVVHALAGCKRLASLELPDATLRRDWAEALAFATPQLAQLKVGGFYPKGDPMRGPCGWKELTLCVSSDLDCLVQLPPETLETLERLHLTDRSLSLYSSPDIVEAQISSLERSAAHLREALLRTARAEGGASRRALLLQLGGGLSAGPGIDPGQASRLIAALGPLGGVISALCLVESLFRLDRSSVETLAIALPRLRILDLTWRRWDRRPPDISDCAWPCFGRLPCLQALVLGDNGRGASAWRCPPCGCNSPGASRLS